MAAASISRTVALALGAEGLLAGGVGCWAWWTNLAPASSFLLLAAGAAFVSGGVLLAVRRNPSRPARPALLLGAVGGWTALALGGLVPFWAAGAAPHAALFDSVSAVTTTGHWSTPAAITDPALVLWRALLQWLGGLATLLLAATVFLPAGLGGAAPAAPGSGSSPAARAALGEITAAYAALTVLCVLLLRATGTGAFDSVVYGASAIATGGDPKGYPSSFANGSAPVILGLFMLAGALWFPGRRDRVRPAPIALLKSEETSLLAVLLAVGIAFTWLAVPDTGLLDSLFLTASLISTSGIVTETRDAAITPLLALAVIGGSVAGAAGGLGLRRVWLLGAILWNEVNRGVQPHEVRTLRYGGQTAEPGLVPALFAFAVLWFSVCAGLATLLSITGLTADDAILGAVAALTNTGPGMSALVGAEAGADDPLGRAVLMAGMLLGRLEVMVLVAVATPSFWSR